MWRKIKIWLGGLANLKFRFPSKEQSVMDQKKRAELHPCVAHRGFSGLAPENTMAAFRLALEQPHLHWIELDVQLSKDHIPVVIHDSTLQRTTSGTGRVDEYTAEELGRLDAGSWFNASFAGEGVPTLDEVLALTSGRCRLNVELKGGDANFELLASKAVEVIRSHHAEKQTVITSFRPELLLAVRKISPELRTGLIIDDAPAGLIEKVVSLGATFLSIGFTHISDRLLAQATKASVEVMAWTVNRVGDLGRLGKRPEPFQLCTNYPDRWLTAIQGD